VVATVDAGAVLIAVDTALAAGVAEAGEPAGAASPDWCRSVEHAVSTTVRQAATTIEDLARMCFSS
jgi:hypothetical protein